MASLSSPHRQAVATAYIRPFNLGRDRYALSHLLQQVFSATLDPHEKQSLQAISFSPPPWEWGLVSMGLPSGFIWEREHKLIGNISLIPTQNRRRIIIANVAVHPNFRRRGIGRQLLEHSLRHLQKQGVKTVQLQVDHDNEGATALYEELGFVGQGVISYWFAGAKQWRNLSNSGLWPTQLGEAIEPLEASQAEEAYQLDVACVPPLLRWPDPISPHDYRPTLWQKLDDFLNGRTHEVWSATENQQLVAVGRICSEWGRAHKLSLRVLSGQEQRWNRPLLEVLLHRLGHLSNRSITLEHRADDLIMNDLLPLAGFTAKRHLRIMTLQF